MNDTAVTIDEQIQAFASAVRAHLDDLPADELDEIVGGLTADLADQAADNDGVLDLGDPQAYAEELRSAAGLPPRTESPARPLLRERIAVWRAGFADGIRRSPFGSWLLDLLISLRPVWWVLRGYALYVIGLFLLLFFTGQGGPQWVVPDTAIEWVVLLTAVIISVQWGRGSWLPRNPLRHVRTVVSVVSLFVLPVALGAAFSPRVEYVTDGYMPGGLVLDGVQINNIFAFDAEGNPIDRVQLFTGKGTPLDLYGNAGGQNFFATENGESQFGVQDDGLRATIPGVDYRGKPVWNVYPLDEADLDQANLQPEVSTVKRPEPPFAKAPSIHSTQETPSPQPTVTPSPEPQATETPVP